MLLATFLLNVMLGSAKLSLTEIWNSFFHPELVESYRLSIIMKIRLPRVLAALAGGSCLAVSGVLLQIFFNNPIVEPYTLICTMTHVLVAQLDRENENQEAK